MNRQLIGSLSLAAAVAFLDVGEPPAAVAADLPKCTVENVKTWETIRLLLACRDAHQRLSQLDEERTELEQERLDFKRKIAEAERAIQQLRSEYGSISAGEHAKESKVENVRFHKEELVAAFQCQE